MTFLHYFGMGLREVFLAVPLTTVRVVFVTLLVLLLLWVWSLPGDASLRTLKWIATAALAIQIAIYAML